MLAHGSASGAAGSSYTVFTLTNTGTSPCSLQGFPGVALLDGSGAILGAPATRNGAPGPAIELAPGARGQFTVQVSDVTQPGCEGPGAVPQSAQIQVYPPNNTVAIRQDFSVATCAVSVTTVALAQ